MFGDRDGKSTGIRAVIPCARSGGVTPVKFAPAQYKKLGTGGDLARYFLAELYCRHLVFPECHVLADLWLSVCPISQFDSRIDTGIIISSTGSSFVLVARNLS